MSTTIEDLEAWVDTMMKKRDIYKYKLDLSGSTAKGDGYLGEVNFLKVVADLSNGKEKTYNLVVKSAKKSDEFRKQTPIQEAYHREMFMYTKVFPVFEEFQKESSIQEPFDKFAKCYSVCQENRKEALIFMNLKSQGYEIHERTIPQNLNHALFVFRNYGKLHGVSIAMKIKKPALFRSLTKNMDDLLAEFINKTKMLDTFKADFRKGVEALRLDNKEDLAKKFAGIEAEIEEILVRPKLPNDAHQVILHGDCWNNNMMFKYEEKNKKEPSDMRFLDFQMSRIHHPIMDLSYYLYSSCDHTCLQNFDLLLDAYHNGMTTTLSQFQIDAENALSTREMKTNWRIYGLFGLLVGAVVMKLMYSEDDEVVDFGEAVKTGLTETFSKDFKAEQKRMKCVKNNYEHFAATCL